jgi:hypothetical protein
LNQFQGEYKITVDEVIEVGVLAIGDTFHEFKLNLSTSQKILNDIEAIIWKLSV